MYQIRKFEVADAAANAAFAAAVNAPNNWLACDVYPHQSRAPEATKFKARRLGFVATVEVKGQKPYVIRGSDQHTLNSLRNKIEIIIKGSEGAPIFASLPYITLRSGNNA